MYGRPVPGGRFARVPSLSSEQAARWLAERTEKTRAVTPASSSLVSARAEAIRAAERWGRFFADLANISVPVVDGAWVNRAATIIGAGHGQVSATDGAWVRRAVTTLDVEAYRASLINGARPYPVPRRPLGSHLRGREAIRREAVRARDALSEQRRLAGVDRDVLVQRWHELRGGLDDGRPDAIVLQLIEEHRRLIRECIASLLGMNGEAAGNVLVDGGWHRGRMPGLLFADASDKLAKRPRSRTTPDAARADVELRAEARDMAGHRTTENESAPTNLWFLAIALPRWILFRRCKIESCDKVLFVGRTRGLYCSARCKAVAWREQAKECPETMARIRAQTALRARRIYAKKCALKQIAQRMETEG